VSASKPLVEALAAIREGLAEAGLAWYLFGARAVAIYGRPRTTADVDLTVAVHPDAVDGLLLLLERYGFHPRVALTQQWIEQTRVLPLVHGPSKIPFDLVVAGPGLETEFLRDRRTLDFDGLMVPVISPEDLVVSKILSGRAKDIDDARGVLLAQGQALDLGRIRNWLHLLEQALDRRDLLPELERALAGLDR
jgi:predicted nucleotidyltransferase